MISAVNDSNALSLFIDILPNENDEMIKTKTLLDCRAGGIFLDQNKIVDMDGIGELLHENLYKQFGLPDKMLSD